MDLNLIKKLVRIVDTSEITDLEVEENGMRVKIAKKIRSNHSQYSTSYSSEPSKHLLWYPLRQLKLKRKLKLRQTCMR
jgi:transposase